MRIHEILESRKTADMKYGEAEVFEIKSKIELNRYIKKFGIVRAMLYPDLMDVWDASDFTHRDYEGHFGNIHDNGFRLQIFKEPTYYIVEYESRTNAKEITQNKIFQQIFKNTKVNLIKSYDWLDESVRIDEINMNIQDIIPLPVINNLPQQNPRKEPLNAQIAGLILALEKFGLMDVANWLAEKIQAADPGATVEAILDRIPQQPPSQASFQRQGMVAKVIANKLGLYTAANHLKQFL